MLAPYAMLWIVLLRALLVCARALAPTCLRSDLKLGREQLGDPVCACSR